MGARTAATWKLISTRVGEGGVMTGGPDVRAVQELLVAAGTTEPNVVGGSWGIHTKNALLAFQKQHQLPERNYVEPNDECLFALAEAAQVLAPMPNKLAMSGVKILHQWFVDNKIGYQEGAQHGGGNRALWGLDFDDCTDYAIQRIDKAWRRGPILMDCTTYVNCMLGVFLHGNLHSLPYRADCHSDNPTAANVHLGCAHYGMQRIDRPVMKGGVTKNEKLFRYGGRYPGCHLTVKPVCD